MQAMKVRAADNVVVTRSRSKRHLDSAHAPQSYHQVCLPGVETDIALSLLLQLP